MPDENSSQIWVNQTSQDDQSATNQTWDDFVLDFWESWDLENTEQSSEEGIQSDWNSEISDSSESAEEKTQDNNWDKTDTDDFDLSFGDSDEDELSDEPENDNNVAENNETGEEQELELQTPDYTENENNKAEEQQGWEQESLDYTAENDDEIEKQQEFEPENFDYTPEDQNDKTWEEENSVEETFDTAREDNNEVENQEDWETVKSDYAVEDTSAETESQEENLWNNDSLAEEKVDENFEEENDFLDIEIPDKVEKNNSDNDILDENDYDSNTEKDSFESENQDKESYEENHNLLVNDEENFKSNDSYSDERIMNENQDNENQQDNTNFEDFWDNNQNGYESDDTNQSNVFSSINEDGEKIDEQPESNDTVPNYSLNDYINWEPENVENEVDLTINQPDLLESSEEVSQEENRDKAEDGWAFNHYEDYLKESEDINQNIDSYPDVNEMNSESKMYDESPIEDKEEWNIMDETQTWESVIDSENNNWITDDEPVKEDNLTVDNSETSDLEVSNLQEQENKPEESALEIKTVLSGDENTNQEISKEDNDTKGQNNGNMTFSLDQILNTDWQQNQQNTPVINTENVEISNQSNWTANKKMIGIVAWVAIFTLLWAVVYLAFPKWSTQKPSDTIVAWIQTADKEIHWVATEESEIEFPDVDNYSNEDGGLIWWDINNNWEDFDIDSGKYWGSTVVDIDDEAWEDEDNEDETPYNEWEKSPAPYIPDETLNDGEDESNLEDNQAFIGQIQEKLQLYKQQWEWYYNYWQERLDNDIIKNAKRIIYLCENYENKIETWEWVDENSWSEVESQILNKLSKITNGGLDDIEFVNNWHLDDDSYFDWKDEHLDYIYDRANG